MRPSADIHYDVALALNQGRRDAQEDAVVADFPQGTGMGFAVLADGMGGHAAGDVASKIVVTEVFSELKMRSGDPEGLRANIRTVLRDAVLSANDCVRFHAESNPETEGMGSTLVAPVLMADRLFWISVGDSPLYLFRDGRLQRLNEDHSMVPQIEYMVSNGIIDVETGRNHPDRNCLTSVLIGDEITQIDCPREPVQLMHDDMVVVASDGLQFLEEDEIARCLAEHAGNTSSEVADALMQGLFRLDDPEQDNISLCVIRVETGARIPAATGAATAKATDRPAGMSFMASARRTGEVLSYHVSMEKSA